MFDFSVLRVLRRQQNLTIEQICERSGISHSFISKLERNIGNPELSTLSRLASALGISSAELVKLAELRSGSIRHASFDESGGFKFEKVAFHTLRIIHGMAAKGARLSRPEVHEHDYEYLYVVRGHVRLSLPGEQHELRTRESMQFDAILKHTYDALEDSELFIVHQRKDVRF